jgi:hypothetical protein
MRHPRKRIAIAVLALAGCAGLLMGQGGGSGTGAPPAPCSETPIYPCPTGASCPYGSQTCLTYGGDFVPVCIPVILPPAICVTGRTNTCGGDVVGEFPPVPCECPVSGACPRV